MALNCVYVRPNMRRNGSLGNRSSRLNGFLSIYLVFTICQRQLQSAGGVAGLRNGQTVRIRPTRFQRPFKTVRTVADKPARSKNSTVYSVKKGVDPAVINMLE